MELKDKQNSSSEFRPLLKDDVQVKLFKEDERGKHFILRNPTNSKYLKMHETVYEIAKLFDGTNTVDDVEKSLKERNIPMTARDLLDILAEDGFIKNLEPGRQAKRDPFSFKIKLLSLDKHAAKLHRLASFVENRFLRMVLLAFSAIGVLLFVSNFNFIFSAASEVLKPETSLTFLLVFFLIYFAQGSAHELAHALVYHHYGGTSVNMGVEFHFMIPFVFTDTLDARWMTEKENLKIFLSGPLTSLFLAEVFTCLYLLDAGLRPVWALSALFSHLSALFSLNPVFRTDGYFIAQALLRIPNLLEHGFANLTQMLKLVFRRISLKEYREYLSQYSRFEKKVIMIYSLSVPAIAVCLSSAAVALGLYFGIVRILLLTSQVLVGATLSLKAYVLLGLWLFGITTMLIGVAGTLVGIARRTKGEIPR